MDSCKCMWSPRAGETTNIDKFRQQVNSKYNLTLGKRYNTTWGEKPAPSGCVCVVIEYLSFTGNYKDLYEWSIEHYDRFWEEFWHYSDILHSKSYNEVYYQPLSPFKACMFVSNTILHVRN